MTKKILCFGIIATLLLNGCTTKRMMNEYNEYANEQIDNISNDKTENASSALRKTEIIQEKKYVDLTVSKKLEDVLMELSNLENKIYMITDEKSNIYVPATISSSLLKIDNLNSLKSYIEDTTNYTLDITKNKFVNNRPKIIKVVDKKALESDFSNLNFQVKSKSTVASALSELSKKINFSIVYKEDLNPTNNNSNGNNLGSPQAITPDSLDFFTEKYFSQEYVYFTGNNVSDFLNYIEQNFDVYTDINYEDKIICISKYKTKMFNVTALNYNIKLTDAQMNNNGASLNSPSSKSGGSTSTNNDAAIQTETEIKGVEVFKTNLENFLVDDKLSKLIFNVDSGQVIVKTTNQNMKEIEKIVNEYNKKYTTQIQITVDIYEFVLNKNYNFGTDIKYNGSSGATAATNFLESNILNSVTNIGKKDITVLVDSKNDFIRYSKSYTYTKDLTNNIPDTINIGNNKKYIASSSTTTTSNTSTTTNTDQQIENLNEGVSITLMPRVVGNKIIIKNEVKINTTNDIVASTDKQGDTIYMPDQDVKTFPGHVVLTSGNKRVIGSYQDFQDVKNYKGAAPIEDFVIAGNSGKSFVKKEIIVVLSAKIL